jgi:hypothetical protein
MAGIAHPPLRAAASKASRHKHFGLAEQTRIAIPAGGVVDPASLPRNLARCGGKATWDAVKRRRRVVTRSDCGDSAENWSTLWLSLALPHLNSSGASFAHHFLFVFPESLDYPESEPAGLGTYISHAPKAAEGRCEFEWHWIAVGCCASISARRLPRSEQSASDK